MKSTMAQVIALVGQVARLDRKGKEAIQRYLTGELEDATYVLTKRKRAEKKAAAGGEQA